MADRVSSKTITDLVTGGGADPWSAYPTVQDDWSAFPEAPKDGDLTVDNVVRSVARGIPILGGAMDNIAAAGDAFTQPLFGRGSDAGTYSERYNANLAQEQGRDAAYDEQHPIASTVGQITGAVASMAPVVAAAPAVFGAGEAPFLLRTGASALTGAGVGGADAAVRSGGDLTETGKGAAIGAAFGAVAPAAGDLIGAGVRKLSETAQRFFANPSNPITGGITPAAMRYAATTISDPAKRQQFFTEIGQLGDEAMLADVSPEWLGIARAAASRPGQRDAIIDPLLARDAGKNTRLRSDLDASLGEVVEPAAVQAHVNTGQEALRPQYGDAFQRAGAVDTEPLANQLEGASSILRGPAQRAARDVRGMLNVPGTDVLDPHPGALMQIRQAIDGLLATEQNPQTIQQLTASRNAVDNELARAVPNIKDIDAQYAELARQGEGFQFGGSIFDTGKTAVRPQEMRDAMAAAPLPQGQQIGPSAVPLRIQQGARTEIDRLSGQAANDPAKLQQALKGEGDWPRQNLRTAFGDERADQALNAVDRETRFYRTRGRVESGSDTAMTNRFGDFLDAAAKPTTVPLDASLTGLAGRGLQAVVRAGTKSAAEANAEKFAEQLGRLAVAQGRSRDDILASLQRAVEMRQIAGKNADDVKMLINAVVRGVGQQSAQ